MNGFAAGINYARDKDYLSQWWSRCSRSYSNSFQDHQSGVFYEAPAHSVFEDRELLCVIYGYLLPLERVENHAYYFATNFIKEGERFLRSLQGAFAAYLHNKASGHAWLVSDHFGANTAYYFSGARGFAASTHLKSLLANPVVQTNFNWARALQYSDTDGQESETVYDNIFRLPAGSFISITGENKTMLTRYLDVLGEEPAHDLNSESEAIRFYKKELQQAVELRMQRPHLTSAFLSGGLDSSVVSLLARPRKGFSVVNPITYQIGDTEKAYDVSRAAVQELDFILFSQQNLPLDDQLWMKILWQTESLSLNIGKLIKYLTHECISRLEPVQEHYILSGLGADQFSGGTARPSLNNDGFAFDNLNHWEAFYDKLERLQWEEMAGKGGRILNLRSLLRPDYFAHASRYNYHKDPWQYYLQATRKEFAQQEVYPEFKTAALFNQWMLYPYLDTQLLNLIKRIPVRLYKPLFFDKMILRQAAAGLEIPFDVQKPKTAINVRQQDNPDAGIYYKLLFNGASETPFMQMAMSALEEAPEVFNVEVLKSHIYYSRKRNETLFSTWLINLANIAVFQKIMRAPAFIDELSMPGYDFHVLRNVDWDQAEKNIREAFNIQDAAAAAAVPLSGNYRLTEDCALLTDQRSGRSYLSKGNQLLFAIPEYKKDFLAFLEKMLAEHVQPSLALQHGIEEEEMQAFLQLAESLGILQADKNFDV